MPPPPPPPPLYYSAHSPMSPPLPRGKRKHGMRGRPPLHRRDVFTMPPHAPHPYHQQQYYMPPNYAPPPPSPHYHVMPPHSLQSPPPPSLPVASSPKVRPLNVTPGKLSSEHSYKQHTAILFRPPTPPPATEQTKNHHQQSSSVLSGAIRRCSSLLSIRRPAPGSILSQQMKLQYKEDTAEDSSDAGEDKTSATSIGGSGSKLPPLQKHERIYCDYCPTRFRKRTALIAHIKHKHRLMKKCPICNVGVKVKGKYNMKFHILKNHKDINTFACGDCGAVFRLQHHLKNHLRLGCEPQPQAEPEPPSIVSEADLELTPADILVPNELTEDGELELLDAESSIDVEEPQSPEPGEPAPVNSPHLVSDGYDDRPRSGKRKKRASTEDSVSDVEDNPKEKTLRGKGAKTLRGRKSAPGLVGTTSNVIAQEKGLILKALSVIDGEESLKEFSSAAGSNLTTKTVEEKAVQDIDRARVEIDVCLIADSVKTEKEHHLSLNKKSETEPKAVNREVLRNSIENNSETLSVKSDTDDSDDHGKLPRPKNMRRRLQTNKFLQQDSKYNLNQEKAESADDSENFSKPLKNSTKSTYLNITTSESASKSTCNEIRKKECNSLKEYEDSGSDETESDDDCKESPKSKKCLSPPSKKRRMMGRDRRFKAHSPGSGHTEESDTGCMSSEPEKVRPSATEKGRPRQLKGRGAASVVHARRGRPPLKSTTKARALSADFQQTQEQNNAQPPLDSNEESGADVVSQPVLKFVRVKTRKESVSPNKRRDRSFRLDSDACSEASEAEAKVGSTSNTKKSPDKKKAAVLESSRKAPRGTRPADSSDSGSESDRESSDSEIEEQKRFFCSSCNAGFSHAFKLKHHRREALCTGLSGSVDKSEVKKENYESAALTAESLVCSLCDKQCRNRYQLRLHMLSHTSKLKKPQKSLKNKLSNASRRGHQRLLHKNLVEEPITATTSDRRSKLSRVNEDNQSEDDGNEARGSGDNNSLSSGHSFNQLPLYIIKKARVFICTKCSLSFKREKSVTYHMKKIHETLYPFKACPQCGRVFRSCGPYNKHLKQHQVRHCPVVGCKARYRAFRKMKQHQKASHDDYPHRCPSCECLYQDQHELDDHVKMSHARTEQQQQDEEDDEDASEGEQQQDGQEDEEEEEGEVEVDVDDSVQEETPKASPEKGMSLLERMDLENLPDKRRTRTELSYKEEEEEELLRARPLPMLDKSPFKRKHGFSRQSDNNFSPKRGMSHRPIKGGKRRISEVEKLKRTDFDIFKGEADVARGSRRKVSDDTEPVVKKKIKNPYNNTNHNPNKIIKKKISKSWTAALKARIRAEARAAATGEPLPPPRPSPPSAPKQTKPKPPPKPVVVKSPPPPPEPPKQLSPSEMLANDNLAALVVRRVAETLASQKVADLKVPEPLPPTPPPAPLQCHPNPPTAHHYYSAPMPHHTSPYLQSPHPYHHPAAYYPAYPVRPPPHMLPSAYHPPPPASPHHHQYTASEDSCSSVDTAQDAPDRPGSPNKVLRFNNF